jgi:hypothetical protein
VAGVTEAEREEIRRRLREDYSFFAESALFIVTKAGQRVPFIHKRPQRRLARALMAQREAGQPQRAIALKARQVGISTESQGIGIGRATQMENHVAMTVAQDRNTTAALFNIGRFMWANLPAQIRPPAAYEGGTIDRKYLQFGEPSLQLRRAGMLGLNSTYETNTAKSAAAARGRTIHTLHLSEVAFWPVDETMLAILQGVPDHPDTVIVKESTANGHNFFKDEWDMAVAGSSGYYAFFTPWFEEDEYRRPFANDADREEFEAQLGSGLKGEDEPGLLEQIPEDLATWAAELGETVEQGEEMELRVLEHLHWRRWAINAKCGGSVDKFHQEYPSTPEEAFLSTGRKVFEPRLVRLVLRAAEKTDPAVPSAENPGPAVGSIRGEDFKSQRARRHVVVDVPQKAVWVPRSRLERGERGCWRLWQLPQPERLEPQPDGGHKRIPAGQYIATLDPASGEVDEKGTEHANHAITVIDHRTRKMVAEYESQKDPDDLALDLLVAAMFYNGAWVVVERTGGYGLSVLRRLAIDFKYARIFEDESRDRRAENRSDRLGFSTDAVSKPLIEAELISILKLAAQGRDLIPSRRVAEQMLSYVRDERGRTKPEPGKLADVLMSLGIGQFVSQIRPLRPDGPREKVSGAVRKFRSRGER